MISETYSIEQFVRAVTGKGLHEVISLARSDIYIAEARINGGKGAVQARKQGAGGYAANLKGLVFALENRAQPMGVGLWAFRPILESLVEQGELDPEVLKKLG